MKKIVSVLLIFMVLSLVITSCARQPSNTQENSMEENTVEEITNGTVAVDETDQELNPDQVEPEINNAEQDLNNW